MKIVNRNKFLKLKTPFIYQKINGNGGCTEELCVATSMMDIDWVYASLSLMPFHNDTEEYLNNLDMLYDGKSMPSYNELVTERDGLYEDEQMFLIYEKEDALVLSNMINDILKNYAI